MQAKVRRARVPVDVAAYRAAGRDPSVPILCCGEPRAPVCCFGRDLGGEEVRAGEPFAGPAGRRLRRAVLRAVEGAGDAPLERALSHVFITNTVPYKPRGDRPFPRRVVELLRPEVERLLVEHWRGSVVLALGRSAFEWFEPYVEGPAVAGSWADQCREGAARSCVIGGGSRTTPRRIRVFALPHPSPANVAWADRFPSLLEERLIAARAAAGRRGRPRRRS